MSSSRDKLKKCRSIDCENKLTDTNRRYQWKRYVRASVPEEEIRKYMPTCQKCTTAILKRNGYTIRTESEWILYQWEIGERN